MGFMSFLSEMISMLLDKGPAEEAEITHSKFVSSIVDTLRSTEASEEVILQTLRDLGAVVYIDDVQSHQLVLDTMPVLLTMFTNRQHSTTQLTTQLLRTLSLVCHRNRVAQNQFHASVEAGQILVELIEGSHGRRLVRIAIAFLHHLSLDNAKILSFWAGEKKMVEALEAASSDDRPWTVWQHNLADHMLKLLAKKLL